MIHSELHGLVIDIDSLKPHPRNIRQGDIGAISESLRTHGQYRSIVYQKSTKNILAGNHTWRAAKALGWKEIAATAVVCNDEEALRILIADNRTSDLADNDDAALSELLKELAQTEAGLDGTLYDGDALDQLLFDLANNSLDDDAVNEYTQAINVPQYQIVGDEPKTSELADKTKATKLIKEIQQSDIPNDVKEFLIDAASRHVVFNYEKIAEFYPHQTPEIQRLMEQSVLIIIDAEDAIANGYATFASTIESLENSDNDYA